MLASIGPGNLAPGEERTTVSTVRRTFVIATALTLLMGLFVAAPAGAANVTCGQVLRSSVKLDADLFCPTGHGLVIQGTGIVLNLNGHTIRGELDSRTVTQPTGLGDDRVLGHPYTSRFAKGQYVGVLVHGSRNVVTGPGTIKHFAAGVAIEGGGQNSVTRLTVEENLGPPDTENYGDGIMIADSTENRVGLNTVRNNGPYDGIVLLGAATRNVVYNNAVTANAIPEVCPNYDVFRFTVSGGNIFRLECGPSHPTRKPFTFFNQQNHGIKFEQGGDGAAAHDNIVQNNTVTANGNSGILLTTTCPEQGPGIPCSGEQHSGNQIRANVVNANGFGYPAGVEDRRIFEGGLNGGSGIVVLLGGPKPAIRSTVVGNTANDNAAHGITVLPHRAGQGNTQSTFMNNTALRNNGLSSPGGFRIFNGFDGNATITPATPCDSNVWRGNNFGSTPADIRGAAPPNNLANHPCVGPVLAESPAEARSASEAAPAPTDDTFAERQHRAAARPSR